MSVLLTFYFTLSRVPARLHVSSQKILSLCPWHFSPGAFFFPKTQTIALCLILWLWFLRLFVALVGELVPKLPNLIVVREAGDSLPYKNKLPNLIVAREAGDSLPYKNKLPNLIRVQE